MMRAKGVSPFTLYFSVSVSVFWPWELLSPMQLELARARISGSWTGIVRLTCQANDPLPHRA